MRVRLEDYPAVSSTTLRDRGALLLGLLFVAASLGAAFAAARGLVDVPMPWWATGSLCATFVVAGLLLAASGWRDLARRRARRHLAETGAAWHGDFAWDPSGATDRSGRSLAPLASCLVLALSLVPFNYLAWQSDQDSLVIQLAVVAFDVLLLLGLGNAIFFLAKARRYADARLVFDEFPFWIDRGVSVRFDPPRRLPECLSVDCTLRCVEEAYERKGRRKEIVCWALYQEARREPAESLPQGLRLVYELPEAGLPGSDLASRPATFWELEIRIETAGIDYLGRFFLPIYAAAAR